MHSPGFTPPAIPDDEAERLEKLRSLALLDSPAEAEYDDLALLAAQLCGTPIALVSLIDAGRQWFKSRVGLDPAETSREVSFCGHAIHGREPFIVADAAADPRFSGNPLVTGEPRIRFYAGMPLHFGDGSALGTLCVIDRMPKILTAEQRHALAALGRQAERLLELRATESRLRDSEALHRLMIEEAADPIYRLDQEGRISYGNPALTKLLGYSMAELTGLHWTKLIVAESRAAEQAYFNGRLQDESLSQPHEFEVAAKNGDRLWLRVTAHAVTTAGKITGYHAMGHDVTDRRQTQAALQEANRLLQEQADHDGLTGLFNRRRFDQYLEAEWRRASREQRVMALILIDVDHFKKYNDSMGHLAGDDALRRIATAISGLCRRPGDLAARYGGEELAVILPGLPLAEAAAFAQQLRLAIEALGLCRSEGGGVTASLGVAGLRPQDGRSPADLIAAADRALYAAKHNGRNRVELAAEEK